jgi:hypothetical protein
MAPPRIIPLLMSRYTTPKDYPHKAESSFILQGSTLPSPVQTNTHRCSWKQLGVYFSLVGHTHTYIYSLPTYVDTHAPHSYPITFWDRDYGQGLVAEMDLTESKGPLSNSLITAPPSHLHCPSLRSSPSTPHRKPLSLPNELELKLNAWSL